MVRTEVMPRLKYNLHMEMTALTSQSTHRHSVS
jgi:hypothetical protein